MVQRLSFRCRRGPESVDQPWCRDSSSRCSSYFHTYNISQKTMLFISWTIFEGVNMSGQYMRSVHYDIVFWTIIFGEGLEGGLYSLHGRSHHKSVHNHTQSNKHPSECRLTWRLSRCREWAMNDSGFIQGFIRRDQVSCQVAEHRVWRDSTHPSPTTILHDSAKGIRTTTAPLWCNLKLRTFLERSCVGVRSIITKLCVHNTNYISNHWFHIFFIMRNHIIHLIWCKTNWLMFSFGKSFWKSSPKRWFSN